MKIALIGYGLEGQSAYQYFSHKYPDAEFVVYDEAKNPKIAPPVGVELVSGKNALAMEVEADILVRTPAVNPANIHATGKVTSVTREFFANCPAPIIGVTGTKGKGTTCSFIQSILQAAGKTCWLVGNIGKPALDVLSQISQNDIVVYELSSFQLWDLDASPHVAVVLMIEPDHLNVHDDFEQYISAKSQITAHQTSADIVVYNCNDPVSTDIADNSAARKIGYGQGGDVFVRDGDFYYNEQKLCSASAVVIPGAHNLGNACAAIAAAWEYVQSPDVIASGLGLFHGLPHHIELVRELDGVQYYDDSFSSAPGATIVAIEAFDSPEIVILGGYDRGIDFAKLAQAVALRSNVKHVLLIGQTRQALASALELAGFSRFTIIDSVDFEEIVMEARMRAVSGDIVLLSPGCASFDMFKDFYQRGDVFKEIVKSW